MPARPERHFRGDMVICRDSIGWLKLFASSDRRPCQAWVLVAGMLLFAEGRKGLGKDPAATQGPSKGPSEGPRRSQEDP